MTVEAAWMNISSEDFQRLVESMPHRVAVFRRAKGGPTRYEDVSHDVCHFSVDTKRERNSKSFFFREPHQEGTLSKGLRNHRRESVSSSLLDGKVYGVGLVNRPALDEGQ
ncbi:hypothetical protein AVEN_134894-1 [Araneus ventricosus]|uniref:Uncharacterized protein n=1 Tax=Araneus ventricosus TaxID=182803 RepID=A0A4Y2CH55_ARAVE|nr:hypothetical protein AVEN_134894-1 [Araneus ventricosus]